MYAYQRGSEWRRWDLHIHTPGTIKNDLFSGVTIDEKWDIFYSDVAAYISDGSDPAKCITVIGVTDYLSVANYNKIIRDNKLPSCVKLVLPNVEMRIQPIAADSPVNMHFIFDPKIVDSLESRFFSQISFSHGGSNYSAARDQLIRFGKKLDPSVDDIIAYKNGIQQFVPSLDSIKEVFEKDPELKDHTIIAVSNSNGDGVSGATNHSSYCETEGSHSQLTLFRQSIYQFVDAIFSSKPSDIKYFLGEGNRDDIETVIRKCGSLKPCLHGCDAHTNSKIFEPDEQRYCWIKSNPTFNGLRHVLYEPKERVRIASLKPEEKPSYYVIDRVEIEDSDFQITPIYFSDKLTCIIGGKSTGKSILLHNLAATIDLKQVLQKNQTAKTNVKTIKNLQVFWADGAVNSSGTTEIDVHKIIYIPQTYLNRLSDENEEVTEIDKIIQDIILIDQDTKSIYDEVQSAIREYKSSLDKTIYDLLDSKRKLSQMESERKELGTEEGIKGEIGKLQAQKDKLSQELALSEEDLKRYDDAVAHIRSIIIKTKTIESEIIFFTSIDSVVEPRSFSIDLSDETRTIFNTAIKKVIQAANSSWNNIKTEILNELTQKKQSLGIEIAKYQKIEVALHDKIIGNEALSNLSQYIQTENAKLEKFKALDKQFNAEKAKYNSYLSQVAQSMLFYRDQHSKYAIAVNDNPNLSTSDLEFSVETPFRKDAFCEKIKLISDKRCLKSIIDIDNFKAEDYTIKNLIKLLNSILVGNLPLVKNNTSETALRDILTDWYNITYSVKMDGDPIELMSPGKKALVLLKLLISLADSKCPILIDQPEDDLDNRSIFDDLIPFIKEKKKKRQIIVVTHNANIVLGSDAEEIIVANQRGRNTPNKEFRFEYRSGAIEDDLPVFNSRNQLDDGILNQQGIQQHVCDILEGGEKAFDLRKNKYRI